MTNPTNISTPVLSPKATITPSPAHKAIDMSRQNMDISHVFHTKMGSDPIANIQWMHGKFTPHEYATYMVLVAFSDDNWQGNTSAEEMSLLFAKIHPRTFTWGINRLADREFITVEDGVHGFSYTILRHPMQPV